jgi:hypothetical protein
MVLCCCQAKKGTPHREARVNGSEKSGRVTASLWADKQMEGPTRRRGNYDYLRSPSSN